MIQSINYRRRENCFFKRKTYQKLARFVNMSILMKEKTDHNKETNKK